MIRRGWEQGETGASLAQRFEVGLANLWRRRASEGWRRAKPEDRVPEPLEGWSRHVAQALMAFEARLAEERLMAERLAGAMVGGSEGDLPLWHLGFIMHWRAGRLGPERAARDAEIGRATDWGAWVWNEDGALRPLDDIDHRLMQANREALRETLGGLPKTADRWLP